MKKLFFLAAAALTALTMNAHTIANPIGTDGRYIVKYDCEAGKFATSNDMEVDETFVFAVDVTGTWLAEWLKGTPSTSEGATRGVAFNNWTSCGDTNGDFRRLKQINGNIYGMTCNFKQAKADAADWTKALMADSVLYVWGQLFGFEFTSDDPGTGWWMMTDAKDSFDGATTQADGADCFFTFAPYTGTKTSEPLYADDYENGAMFGFQITGYAAPCLDEPMAIHNTTATVKAQKVIENGQIYLINNGVRYNALGAVVK